MTAVDVAVYQPDATTLIADIPRRQGVQWLHELNGDGSGSFQIHLDDAVLTAHPEILTGGNIVKLRQPGGADFFAFLIEELAPVQTSSGENAGRWVTISGRGIRAVLSCATVWPEYGLRPYGPDNRSFDFSSAAGDWYISADWFAPQGVRQDSDPTPRGVLSPRAWPDPAAQWIWATNPTVGSVAGRQWFRAEFTLAATTTIGVWASADNHLSLRLDGEVVISTDPTRRNNWTDTFTYSDTLAAGTHTIAAWVENAPSASLNPAGFLATVGTVKANGDLDTVLLRTNTTDWLVHDYGNDPGWHGGQILTTLISEAQTRGVNAVTGMTLGYSSTLDSDGQAWDDRQDRTFNIGTDLLDVLNQVSEVALDCDVTPALVLEAWKRRGTDLTATVTLGPVLSNPPTARLGQIRNNSLIKHGEGWLEVTDATSATAYGRRETSLSLGSADGETQATTVADALFAEVAQPQVTLPITIASVDGPQPYDAFTLGDTITAPGLYGTLGPARVMSIAGAETDLLITWDLDLYPEP